MLEDEPVPVALSDVDVEAEGDADTEEDRLADGVTVEGGLGVLEPARNKGASRAKLNETLLALSAASCILRTPSVRPEDVLGAAACMKLPMVTYAQEPSLWYQQFHALGR